MTKKEIYLAILGILIITGTLLVLAINLIKKDTPEMPSHETYMTEIYNLRENCK